MGKLSIARGRVCLSLAAAVTIAATTGLAGADKSPKPTVSLRANPAIGFAPVRVVLTAELKGGADDYEEFYCATVEWVWGDDTKSESKNDCDPYQAGKSEIQRRFVTDRTFQEAGDYRVEFRLKQKNKIVGIGRTEVKIREGLGGRH
jgi:hypothetical protein